MVVKAGGYFITLEEAMQWLSHYPESKYHPPDETDVSWKSRVLFEDKKIGGIRPVAVLHPKLNIAIHLFVTKIENDLYSTFHNCAEYQETDRDRFLKKKVMEMTGVSDDEVKWITVPDPFMKDSDRYVQPRHSKRDQCTA